MTTNGFHSQAFTRFPWLSGETAYKLAKVDWSQKAAGPPGQWPHALDPFFQLCFLSVEPTAIVWGEQQGHLFNQAWAERLASGSWEASGAAFGATWNAVWEDCQQIYECARAGEGVSAPRTRLFTSNSDGTAERYFSIVATPLHYDSTHAVLITAQEVTTECLAERRLQILRDLAIQYRDTDSVADNCQWFLDTLANHEAEVPFAAAYWIEPNQQRASRLCGAGCGVTEILPETIELGSGDPGRHLLNVIQRRQPAIVSAEEELGISLHGPYPEPIQSCVLYPITKRGQDLPPTVLLMGVSPRLTLDDQYLGFFRLLGIAFQQLMSGAHTRSRWAAANAALIASERRYRAIVEGQSEMVCRFLPDGTILFANGAYARACDSTPEELEGGNFWDLVEENDRPAVAKLLAQISRDSPEVNIENRFQMGDQYRWTRWSNRGLTFDAEGRPTEIQSVGVDITDRRRAEQALQEREEQLRLALQGANAGAWSLDVTTGSTFWSQQFRSLYGYSPDMEPSFSRWLESIHAADRGWVKRAFRARPYSTSSEYQQEFRIIHPQHGERWLLAMGRVERDLDGNAKRISGINIDITERKAVEEALRESEERLKEADRRKDEFLATLAHELRNPLAPIRNSLEVMRLAGDDKAAVDKARGIMERQLAHMVHLINDLLDLSRISRGKVTLRKERVPIAEVLEQAVETCRPLIDEAGHQLDISLPSDAVYVEADPARMAQVFANLLSNATKFTPPGGKIWLSARAEPERVVVRVRDNGSGIVGGMLEKIFDMFIQNAPEQHVQGGLGIGLSLVRGLVEMHGGQVEARSAGPGQGSEFVVSLPTVAAVDLPEDAGSKSRDTNIDGLRVLVVDDNRDAANSMATMLELMGYETRVAFDGLAALNVAADFRPHVALLDIGMPKLDGYETARRMRQQSWGQRMKLVALTGWGQTEDRRRSQDAGFDSHLVKPADLATLRDLLANEDA